MKKFYILGPDIHEWYLLFISEVEIQPSPALAYRTIGGILDFYIFTGPTSDKVVQQYTELIGRPFMPPLWSLGFHLCRWDYGGTAGLKKVIQRMRSANMPFVRNYFFLIYCITKAANFAM